ncbi:hypothetical protein FRC00_011206, partial [Tulasnella sp. 408]
MQAEPPKPKEHPEISAQDPLWKLMCRCWDSQPAARPTISNVLEELWRDMDNKQSNPWSRPNLLSALDDNASDSSDADLDIGPQQGDILTSLTPDVVPLGGSYSPSQAAEMCDPAHEEVLVTAQKILKRLETSSKGVPVMGTYIEAIVEVGSTLIEIVQNMDRSGEIAERLERRIWKLAMLLEDLAEKSSKCLNDEIDIRITRVQ